MDFHNQSFIFIYRYNFCYCLSIAVLFYIFLIFLVNLILLFIIKFNLFPIKTIAFLVKSVYTVIWDKKYMILANYQTMLHSHIFINSYIFV